MLKKVDTPMDLFTHKLGAALTMEHTVLRMLAELEKEARHEELKQLFRHHAEETNEQISNLERAFGALGHEPDKKPCPAITALRVEGKANIELTNGDFVEDVLLAAATETEHHEIAVYEELITYAEAMGRQDVAALLRENLEQEQHTLEEVRRAAEQIAEETLQLA
jgi:ferritin-like metal-binding protein YciE